MKKLKRIWRSAGFPVIFGLFATITAAGSMEASTAVDFRSCFQVGGKQAPIREAGIQSLFDCYSIKLEDLILPDEKRLNQPYSEKIPAECLRLIDSKLLAIPEFNKFFVNALIKAKEAPIIQHFLHNPSSMDSHINMLNSLFTQEFLSLYRGIPEGLNRERLAGAFAKFYFVSFVTSLTENINSVYTSNIFHKTLTHYKNDKIVLATFLLSSSSINTAYDYFCGNQLAVNQLDFIRFYGYLADIHKDYMLAYSRTSEKTEQKQSISRESDTLKRTSKRRIKTTLNNAQKPGAQPRNKRLRSSPLLFQQPGQPLSASNNPLSVPNKPALTIANPPLFSGSPAKPVQRNEPQLPTGPALWTEITRYHPSPLALAPWGGSPVWPSPSPIIQIFIQFPLVIKSDPRERRRSYVPLRPAVNGDVSQEFLPPLGTMPASALKVSHGSPVIGDPSTQYPIEMGQPSLTPEWTLRPYKSDPIPLERATISVSPRRKSNQPPLSTQPSAQALQQTRAWQEHWSAQPEITRAEMKNSQQSRVCTATTSAKVATASIIQESMHSIYKEVRHTIKLVNLGGRTFVEYREELESRHSETERNLLALKLHTAEEIMLSELEAEIKLQTRQRLYQLGYTVPQEILEECWSSLHCGESAPFL